MEIPNTISKLKFKRNVQTKFPNQSICHYQRRAKNSCPPAYPGCQGLHPQIFSCDTLASVYSSLIDYGKVVPNHTVFCV